MALARFRVLIHDFFNKDPDIVPQEAPIIILNGKSDFFMAKNGKDINHTSYFPRRVNFVRIYWCKGGLKMADIATKNVG